MTSFSACPYETCQKNVIESDYIEKRRGEARPSLSHLKAIQ